MQPALLKYVTQHIDLIRKRDFLIELFTACDRVRYGDVISYQGRLYRGKLLNRDGVFVGVDDFVIVDTYTYQIKSVIETDIVVPADGEALVTATDRITLLPGVLANSGPKPLQTTFGRMLLNYLILSHPFGSVFPYINDNTWNAGAIGNMLIKAVTEEVITAEQINTYVKNMYFIGHMTELCVPNYTEKSLVTDPKVAVRRKELLAEYADELAKGNPVAMSRIESELIKMDKDWLKDDESMDFFMKSLGKSFNVQRKKMLGVGGMIEKFGQPGKFNFLDAPLSDGITIENFPIVTNEIRMASTSRALETQDGGVAAKSLSRALQNATILEDDCGTKRTMPVTLKKDTASQYRNRYAMFSGRKVELTEAVIQANLGKTVAMRSPMTCATKGGYCTTCMGRLFDVLDQASLTMRALAFSSFLITLSLKKSHGLSYETLDISDLDSYTF